MVLISQFCRGSISFIFIVRRQGLILELLPHLSISPFTFVKEGFSPLHFYFLLVAYLLWANWFMVWLEGVLFSFQFSNHFIVRMLSFSCSKQTEMQGLCFAAFLLPELFLWIYKSRLPDCQSRVSIWKLSCSSGWLVGGSTSFTVSVKKLPLGVILCACTQNASGIEPTCVWICISCQRAGRVGCANPSEMQNRLFWKV